MTELSLCLVCLVLSLLVICSQLPSSRSLVFCADSGHLPHSPVPHTLHLSCCFPRLSCPFLSLPCNDLLVFPLSPFFYCFFIIFLHFFPVLLHLPWLFPAPPQLHVFVIVCQEQDIQWGWPAHGFAAAVCIQKEHFEHRSCSLLATQYA